MVILNAMFKNDGIKLHAPWLASLLLRIGLAVVFVYTAIDAWREPQAWLGFIPPFTKHVADAQTLLNIASIGQIILAVWLVSGKYLRYAACLTVLTLVTIIAFNSSSLFITFRDFGLIFMAFALLFIDI